MYAVGRRCRAAEKASCFAAVPANAVPHEKVIRRHRKIAFAIIGGMLYNIVLDIKKGETAVSDRITQLLIDSFWKILLPGLTATIPLTIISFSLALVIATVTALVQFAQIPVLTPIARFYIWITRGTPLLVQLFVIFFGLPRVGVVLDPFPAAIIVFAFNTGAYDAETIRAALESVPQSQLEAGECVGMTYRQTIRRIVLPQAMRTAFPSLSNSLISLVKDTSLAANITVSEMFMTTQRIVARTYEPLLLYLEVGLIYLLFSTVLSRLQNRGEKRLNSYRKRGVN